jgi:excisionase family DNA binding protein
MPGLIKRPGCETVSVDEAAERLGYNRNSIYDAIKRGEIHAIKLGSKVRIAVATIERCLGRRVRHERRGRARYP